MEPLCVLYAFDENYAPYAGVSICSLLEHNKALPFSLVAATDGVCEATRDALRALARTYGREITFVNSSPVTARIAACGIPAYRGSQSANVRLFFDTVLPQMPSRVLYLDCDTLVCGDLSALFAWELNGAPAAAVQDSLSARYKRLLGFAEEEPYYNSGVLLIDTGAWIAKKVPERIEKHATEVRAAYRNPDQDLLNLVLKGELATLPPAYNLQPHHSAFASATYLRVYHQCCYYTAEALEDAARAPAILHAYRYLGAFPWQKSSHHPHAPCWEYYLTKTPWNGAQKKPAAGGLIFTAERILYRILPRRAFLALFARVTDRRARREEKKIKKVL